MTFGYSTPPEIESFERSSSSPFELRFTLSIAVKKSGKVLKCSNVNNLCSLYHAQILSIRMIFLLFATISYASEWSENSINCLFQTKVLVDIITITQIVAAQNNLPYKSFEIN